MSLVRLGVAGGGGYTGQTKREAPVDPTIDSRAKSKAKAEAKAKEPTIPIQNTDTETTQSAKAPKIKQPKFDETPLNTLTNINARMDTSEKKTHWLRMNVPYLRDQLILRRVKIEKGIKKTDLVKQILNIAGIRNNA